MNAGCTLNVPDDVEKNKEAVGDNGKPLFIFTEIKVLGVRDVPDIGGSYGVDIR